MIYLKFDEAPTMNESSGQLCVGEVLQGMNSILQSHQLILIQ